MIVIPSSYSSGLSIDHSIKSRDIFKSEKFEYLYKDYFIKKFGKEIEMKSDKDNKTNWANNFGGERIVTSTGGTITGRHAHLILVDDGMNAEQAASEKFRETAHRFYGRTMASRKKDKEKTITIYIEQRLHENDLTGINLKKKVKKIKHICLPGKLSDNVNPSELKKIYQKNLLDPIRLNEYVLSEMKEDLGSYGFAGQIQQSPAPEEGGKIKKEWFEIVNINNIPKYAALDVFIDGAYTKKTTNDPTGIDIFYFSKQEKILYWIYSFDKHLEMPELLKYITELQNNFNITKQSRIFIEPKASGKTLKQLLLKYSGLNAIEIKSKLVNEGKIAAVDATSPTIESGRVKLVQGTWNEHVLNQLATFPNAEHDEHVDNLAYAIDNFFITTKSEWDYNW